MTRIRVFRGDTPTLAFELKDGSTDPPSAWDLTGYVIRLYLRQRGGTKTVDATGSITDALAGKGEVTLTTTHTNTVGDYDAEVEIRKGTTVLTADPQFEVEVIQDLRTAA